MRNSNYIQDLQKEDAKIDGELIFENTEDWEFLALKKDMNPIKINSRMSSRLKIKINPHLGRLWRNSKIPKTKRKS